VLVSGPAGSGKTSTAADWVRRRRAQTGATGWIAFEDGDAFWANLIECLRRLGLEMPTGPAAPLSASPDAVLGRERLGALARLIADHPRRWTVVLDGYELTSIELAREVDLLLRHTFGHLCLVFVSRVDPVLPLYRYRLEETLGEVRAADLAFTDQEAAELLSHLGVSLSDEAVHELNERVRGWAAGLRFAARALVDNEDPESAVATVVAQAGDINEYLLGEVLEAQPTEVRRFLLETCVPDLLCPGLLEELAGPRAVHILESVARSNAFIEPVPDQPGCYRYYPFFRELLRAQLAYESPGKMVDLHRRAAGWFDREGLTERSIAHLATIGAWDAVAVQMVNGLMVGRVVLEGGRGPISSLARQMPADLEGAAPALVRAAGALSRDDRAECADELRVARGTAADNGVREDRRRRSIAVLDAVRGSIAEDAEGAAALSEEADRALRGVSPRSRLGPEAELFALARLSAGIAALRRGDLTRARKALTTAAGLEPARRFASFRSDCLGYLAVVDALDTYLSRARSAATESLSIASGTGGPRSAAADVALACIGLERYEIDTAREHVAAAILTPSFDGDPVCSALLEGVIAGLERADGPLEPALSRLEIRAGAIADSDPWLSDHLRLEAAKLSVASGRAELALDELGAVEQSQGPEASVVAAAAYAEQGQRAAVEDSLGRMQKAQPTLSVQVSRLLVEVVRESWRPSRGRARVVLDRALRLAAPEAHRRPFREAGPAVQVLLAADPRLILEHPWLNPGSSSPHRSRYGDKVVRAAAEAGPELVETLTPKELEVLGHLEELLTTEEIAEKMFVSVNTVRTHVRSILRKLGVTRRNAAVRKARELGLFAA